LAWIGTWHTAREKIAISVGFGNTAEIQQWLGNSAQLIFGRIYPSLKGKIMRLLTANHGDARLVFGTTENDRIAARVFTGWTRKVEFIEDGRCYLSQGVRVGSELLVSNDVRLFHEIRHNGPHAYSQAFLHLARADVVAENNELTLIPGDDHGDVMIWFAKGIVSRAQTTAQQIGKDSTYVLKPGQRVVTHGDWSHIGWHWNGTDLKIRTVDRWCTHVISESTCTPACPQESAR
jgi:hypothetical protein